MVRYHCSNCGAEADSDNGCRSCGRTPQQELAALSLMITQMQVRYKDFTDQRVLMNKRIQGAITRRSLLSEEVRATSGKGVTGAVRRASRGGQPGPAHTPVPGQRGYAKGEQQSTDRNRVGGEGNVRTVTPPIQRAPTTAPATPAPVGDATPHQHGPETSTRSSQNILLGLGALLFAVAAVVLAGYLLPVIGAGGRALIFLLLTALALAAPQLLVAPGCRPPRRPSPRSGWSSCCSTGTTSGRPGWLSGSGLTGAAYAGLVCLGAAGVAAAYRAQTHLVTPRFARGRCSSSR